MNSDNTILEQYDQERDPLKRLEYLQQLRESLPEGDEEAEALQAYRELLFDLRYGKLRSRKSGKSLFSGLLRETNQQPADQMLRAMMDLIYYSGSTVSNTGARRKNVIQDLFRMGLLDERYAGPEFERELYRELRHAVRVYIATCKSSSYGRKIFGLMESNEHEKLERCTNDLWRMSYGVASVFHMKTEMSLFIRAVEDEYAQIDGTSGSLSAYNP